jgi:hypothetical protein
VRSTRLLARLADAQDECHAWGNKMLSYSKRKDSPEYKEAFRRTNAAHNNICRPTIVHRVAAR